MAISIGSICNFKRDFPLFVGQRSMTIIKADTKVKVIEFRKNERCSIELLDDESGIDIIDNVSVDDLIIYKDKTTNNKRTRYG